MNDDEKIQLIKLLTEIQNRLSTSHLMNGGFERLMDKINKIEESQDKMVEDFQDLKSTVYDPDAGVFSRIKQLEVDYKEKNHQIEKELYEMKIQNSQFQKIIVKFESQEDKLEELFRWKANYTKFTWLIISGAVAGAFEIVKNIIHFKF